MDPNLARSVMVGKASEVLAFASLEGSTRAELEAAAVDLAEAVHDLDTWLRAGGFLPNEWCVKTGVPGVSQTGRKQDVDV